ncbi:MAG: DUF1573 domain-containing protein [Cytophagales bacterium]
MIKFTAKVIFFFVVSICVGQAHVTSIKFEKSEIDFGQIIENQDALIGEFSFTNIGNHPLVIKNVQASCGCAVLDWTKDTVRIGRSGVVRVKYQTDNRPGPFTKTFTVVSNTKPELNPLIIKGIVIPKSIPIEQRLPALLGNLRFPSQNITLGTVKTDQIIDRDIEVFNTGETPINIKSTQKYEHINVSFSNNTIAPKSSVKISLQFSPVKKKEYGFTSSLLIFETDDELEPIKKINLTATIEEAFPELKPSDLAQAPKAFIAKQEINLGRIQRGENKLVSFPIKNNGKKPLKILQIKPSCSCLSANADKYVLYQGETTNINLLLSTQELDGLQTKTVTVFTNDPSNHTQKIVIKSDVAK